MCSEAYVNVICDAIRLNENTAWSAVGVIERNAALSRRPSRKEINVKVNIARCDNVSGLNKIKDEALWS